jgi:hypothetical protein
MVCPFWHSEEHLSYEGYDRILQHREFTVTPSLTKTQVQRIQWFKRITPWWGGEEIDFQIYLSNKHAGPATPILSMLLHVPLVDQADYVHPPELKDPKQYASEYKSKIGMLSEEGVSRIVEEFIIRIYPEWQPNHLPLCRFDSRSRLRSEISE